MKDLIFSKYEDDNGNKVKGKYFVQFFQDGAWLPLGTVEKCESATRSSWGFIPNPSCIPTFCNDSPQDVGGWKRWSQTRLGAVSQYYGDAIFNGSKIKTTKLKTRKEVKPHDKVKSQYGIGKITEVCDLDGGERTRVTIEGGNIEDGSDWKYSTIMQDDDILLVLEKERPPLKEQCDDIIREQAKRIFS